MSTKTALCTCQKFCQAPPGGKAIPMRTWYSHAAQRALEEQMTREDCNAQKSRIRKAKRPRQSQLQNETGLESLDSESIDDVDMFMPVPDHMESNNASLDPNDQRQWVPLYIKCLFESFNGPCFRGQDVDSDADTPNNLFNLDQDGSSLGCTQTESQPGVILEDLVRIQSTISQIQSYSFSYEKTQWTDDEFNAFLNPPHEPYDLEDPQLQLSFKIYLSLSAHSSEATYESIRSSIKECYNDSTILSFDQARNRLKRATGILPLHFDMCINTCLAYTGTFSPLNECPFCGERRYKQHHEIEPRVPRRQFATLPIGPQLQALWRHPISVAKVRDRLRRTKILLAQRNADGGIQDYDDVCCGSEYLDLVESGEISDNDMVLILSMDGAQLYRNKESDAWFGIATLIDLAPEIRHAKEMVLPAFVIGGPNPPKNYDSFLFPTFAHLSACQRLGLTIWDSSDHTSFTMCPWFGFGTADTVGMAELNGWVGHHGRNGCRVLCSMPGRHKPGAGTYYPVMLKPHGPLPSGSSHPDININTITIPSLDDYTERLRHVLCSRSNREYERRRRETGISKPSIVSALPRSIPVPKCFPADTMHLFGLNISQLLVALWRANIEHTQDDPPTTWQFAVLQDSVVWQSHGASVARAGLYLPVCLESRVPRNPAEKISSGYKAVEYLVYVFGLCPALLYGILPPKFYNHFCKLVFAARIVHRRHKSKEDLLAAHRALLEFVYEFELLYYERKLTRLHFVRPCIHALTHIVPEHFRLGSLTELSQWTMERTIGNLGEEIRLHSDPYANLSQRIIERARTNALYALAPNIFHATEKLPSTACDIGDNYILLGPREHHKMEGATLDAFIKFSDLHHWVIKGGPLDVDQFARLLLPNGQIARSWWHEKKRPTEKVRVSRNVKLNVKGTLQFAEVLFFFLVMKKDLRYTLAAVQMFGDTDGRILQDSYGTLHVCKYLGKNGTQIIDTKWITDVIAMVPFKSTPGEKTYAEGKQYFAVEKMSTTVLRRCDADDIDEENSE